MNKIIMLLMMLLLSACGPASNAPNEITWHPEVDHKLEHQYFIECLDALPAGPQQTHYNDWDEVVDSCETAALHQATTWVPNK